MICKTRTIEIVRTKTVRTVDGGSETGLRQDSPISYEICMGLALGRTSSHRRKLAKGPRKRLTKDLQRSPLRIVNNRSRFSYRSPRRKWLRFGTVSEISLAVAKPPFSSGTHPYGSGSRVQTRRSLLLELRYHIARSYNIFDGRWRVREIGLTSVHIGFSLPGPLLPFTLHVDKDYRGGQTWHDRREKYGIDTASKR